MACFPLRCLLFVFGITVLTTTCYATTQVVSDGVVVFEAEDYTSNVSRSGQEWDFTNSVAGFSSNGYMVAAPDLGSVIDAAWTNTSPELQYDVNFNPAATYYVWVRAFPTSGVNDSVHAGLDGQTGAADRISWTTYGGWMWTNKTLGGGAASISVSSTGSHTFSVWMREDGAAIDRVVLTTNANFFPRHGNAWHIPNNPEPAGFTMRTPPSAIYSNTAVLIFSGNQFAGGGAQGNQLQIGSAIYYKNAASNVWNSLPMGGYGTAGNNIYYTNSIPPNVFKAGDVVQYYLKIPYSEFLPTYLYESNGSSFATEMEEVAKANPFTYTVLSPPGGAQHYASPDDWRDENIYFIFMDRFFDGDPSNNNADPEQAYSPTNSRGIHGGDFKGIQQKLDYIKALGANAIWITPIPKNVGSSSYHGYGAHDFTQVAPHWGTQADLSNMVAAAHARGIRVVLDIVVNHQGNRISSGDAGYPTYNTNGYHLRWTVATNQYPAPFNSTNYFHKFGNIASFTDPQQILGELNGLDDLQTETTYVRTNMANIYNAWIDAADFDGFRIDTVKHVDMGFWQYFNPAIRAHATAIGKTNFFQFGEVFDGSDAKCGSYTGTKAGGAFANDAVVDYPLYFLVNSVFATAAGNTQQIENRYAQLAANYDASAQSRLVTFLDNHDQPRFLSSGNANNNTNRLAVALTFLYSSLGIPCLYYGTEQAFNGAGDPNNREDMFAGKFEQGPSRGDNFNMTHPTFQLVAKLNNFRRLYPSLREGSHVNLWNNPSGPGLFAYARRLGTEEVFVVFNTAGSSQTLTNRPTSYPPGTKLVNLFNTNESVIVTANSNTPPGSIPGTSAKMFVSAALWKPLDPVVISQVPAHGASNVSPNVAIVLKFSKAMDTNSTQAAFSIQPVTAGSFSWNVARDTMTFTPGFSLAGSTTNVIKIATNALDGVSANAFYAPFETYFITATSALSDTISPAITISQPADGSSISNTILVTGTATDNVAVQSVEFRLDNGSWVAVTGTTSWSYAFDSANFLNGSHVLSAHAIDTLGNVSTNASVGVRFLNVPGAYVQRISPGNTGDATDCTGAVWVVDRPYSFGSFGFSGGTTGYVANTISGICAGAQSLYQRERYSTPAASFDYVFDCPEGIYETTILEAETFVTNVDQRVFDVYIEDAQVLTNFDILAATGAMNVPISLTFTNAVADGQLLVHFLPRTDNARASGIQVRKIGDVDTDNDGIPDWWMRAQFDHPTGQDADGSLAGDDADGDGFDNFEEYISGTDPLDLNSYLHVASITASAGTTLMIQSTTNRSYSVLAVPDLSGTNAWSDVETNRPGTGGPLSITDTNGAGLRFYRVKVTLP